jgi:hypothetical protein
MPSLSMFYGIIVYMYYKDNNQHNKPHIHAIYQDDEVIVEIPNGEILEGSIPNSKMKLLSAKMSLLLIGNWPLKGNHLIR